MFGGPIFDDEQLYIGPDENIEVPDQFFQIVIAEDNDAVAFLFPHPSDLSEDDDCQGGSDPVDSNTTIDEIERLTGLDFFSDLSASAERALERKRNAGLWK